MKSELHLANAYALMYEYSMVFDIAKRGHSKRNLNKEIVPNSQVLLVLV